MKRLLDVIAAAIGLWILSPVFAVLLGLIWAQDGKSPLYIADRVGRDGRLFRMVKIRSMVTGADRTGVESTGARDDRITPLGAFVRRWKLDELTQLWNVLRGDMSLVGPRPNTVRCVADYDVAERGLLTVRPGITDFASIVFSDEGDILANAVDPDAAYDRVIRPWKSRLGLLYAKQAGAMLDVRIILLTLLALLDKPRALFAMQPILRTLGADADLLAIARRNHPLHDGK